jgi:hypothetical protein
MSHCGMDYPKEAPLECLRELVRIVRQGGIVVERAAFARHAWNVQGYLQRLALGDPVSVIGSAGVAESAGEASDDEAISSLELLAEQACEEAAVSRGIGLPASVLLRWLLGRLLDSLLSGKE